MSETFREWLEHEHGEKDRFVLVSRVIEEFDRRFIVATLEELATSTGTVWIEEEQGDE